MASDTRLEWLTTQGGQEMPFAVPKGIKDEQAVIDHIERDYADALIAADRVGSDIDPDDEAPGNWERWFNQLADGVLFGGGDELTGAANVLPGYVSRLVDGDIEMPESINELRQQISDIYTVEKAKARSSRSGELSADLASIPASMALPGANVVKIGQFMKSAPRWLKAGIDLAANGALWGSVTGGLSTEGDLGDRASGAAQGAVMGSIAAPAVAAAAKPVLAGAQNVAAALGLDSRGRAIQQVRRALEDDSTTIGRVTDDLVAAGAKPATIADVAGDNTRRLARQAAGHPGKASQQAKEVFLGRQSRDPTADPRTQTYQTGRIISDLRQGVMEGDLERFGVAHAALQRKRSADAGPLYERAWKMPMPFSMELEDLLKRPTVRTALRDSMDSLDDEAWQNMQKLLTMDDAGNVIGTQSVPDTKTWHYIKIALDEFLNSAKAKNDQGRLNGRGRAILDAKRTIVQALDDATRVPKAKPEYKALPAPARDGGSRQLVPLTGDGGDLVLPGPGAKWDEGETESIYQKARSMWAGPSAEISAMEAGRDAMRGGKDYIDDMQSMWDGFGVGEKNAFRLGVISQIEQMLSTRKGNLDGAKQLAQTPWYQDVLRMVAPTEKGYKRMMERLALEDQMKETSNMVLSGSQTSPRMNDDASQKLGAVIMDTLLGGLRSGAQGMRRAAAGVSGESGRIRENVMDIVADPSLAKFGKADEVRRAGQRRGALSEAVGTATVPSRAARGAISATIDEESYSPRPQPR